MNRKMIGKVLSFLLLLETLFLLPSAIIAFACGEDAAARGIVSTMGISLLVGLSIWLICHDAQRSFYAREGFLITALGWMLMSAVGALPFYLSGEIPSYVDALFETVSGFTTTGSSILGDVEAMSLSLLLWRSLTNWLGGMGVLVFLLAVMPTGKGGYSIHVLRAESPGPSVGKLVPKIRRTAAILYLIYVVLTVLCMIFLLLGGMSVFDSVCTALSTAGTGGFGVRSASLAAFSPYCQTVCTVFMILFGVNFSVYFLLLLRKWKQALLGAELKFYAAALISSTAIITINILPSFPSAREALHHAAFAVASIVSTTGFATEDFDLWPQLSRSILVVLMVMGACAGSTSGGVKVARIVLLMKSLRARIRQMLHPRSVTLVRVDGRTIDDSVLHGVNTYMSAYCFIAIISFLILTLDGLSFETNITATLSCLNNIGPGLDAVGPTANYAVFSPLSKFVLMLDMLLGRLEIFPLLVLLSPKVWKRTD